MKASTARAKIPSLSQARKENLGKMGKSERVEKGKVVSSSSSLKKGKKSASNLNSANSVITQRSKPLTQEELQNLSAKSVLSEISLPPLLNGPVQGYFYIDFGPIQFSPSYKQTALSNPVFIFKWWGCANPSTIAPITPTSSVAAETRAAGSKSKIASISPAASHSSLRNGTACCLRFPILCKLPSFQTYLNDCSSIAFKFLDASTTGAVIVNVAERVEESCSNGGYWEEAGRVFRSSGEEIGKVKITFSFAFQQESEKTVDPTDAVLIPPASSPLNKASFVISPNETPLPSPLKQPVPPEPMVIVENDIEEAFLGKPQPSTRKEVSGKSGRSKSSLGISDKGSSSSKHQQVPKKSKKLDGSKSVSSSPKKAKSSDKNGELDWIQDMLAKAENLRSRMDAALSQQGSPARSSKSLVPDHDHDDEGESETDNVLTNLQEDLLIASVLNNPNVKYKLNETSSNLSRMDDFNESSFETATHDDGTDGDGDISFSKKIRIMKGIHDSIKEKKQEILERINLEQKNPLVAASPTKIDPSPPVSSLNRPRKQQFIFWQMVSISMPPKDYENYKLCITSRYSYPPSHKSTLESPNFDFSANGLEQEQGKYFFGNSLWYCQPINHSNIVKAEGPSAIPHASLSLEIWKIVNKKRKLLGVLILDLVKEVDWSLFPLNDQNQTPDMDNRWPPWDMQNVYRIKRIITSDEDVSAETEAFALGQMLRLELRMAVGTLSQCHYFRRTFKNQSSQQDSIGSKPLPLPPLPTYPLVPLSATENKPKGSAPSLVPDVTKSVASLSINPVGKESVSVQTSAIHLNETFTSTTDISGPKVKSVQSLAPKTETVTEVNNNEKPLMLECRVVKALHLPKVLDPSSGSEIEPNVCVTLKPEPPTLSKTNASGWQSEIISKSCNPNFSEPSSLFTLSSEREKGVALTQLKLYFWHVATQSEDGLWQSGRSLLLGSAKIDLKPLVKHGLNPLSGWYHVYDYNGMEGMIKGQAFVSVWMDYPMMPLPPSSMSPYPISLDPSPHQEQQMFRNPSLLEFHREYDSASDAIYAASMEREMESARQESNDMDEAEVEGPRDEESVKVAASDVKDILKRTLQELDQILFKKAVGKTRAVPTEPDEPVCNEPASDESHEPEPVAENLQTVEVEVEPTINDQKDKVIEAIQDHEQSDPKGELIVFSTDEEEEVPVVSQTVSSKLPLTHSPCHPQVSSTVPNFFGNDVFAASKNVASSGSSSSSDEEEWQQISIPSKKLQIMSRVEKEAATAVPIHKPPAEPLKKEEDDGKTGAFVYAAPASLLDTRESLRVAFNKAQSRLEKLEGKVVEEEGNMADKPPSGLPRSLSPKTRVALAKRKHSKSD